MYRVPTILNFIPHNHTRHPRPCRDSAVICNFTFKGMQLTWTRLAQGFVDSPAVFSAAVKRVLNTVTNLPSTVCVLNYTDDILITAETEADCLQASMCKTT